MSLGGILAPQPAGQVNQPSVEGMFQQILQAVQKSVRFAHFTKKTRCNDEARIY